MSVVAAQAGPFLVPLKFVMGALVAVGGSGVLVGVDVGGTVVAVGVDVDVAPGGGVFVRVLVAVG